VEELTLFLKIKELNLMTNSG